MTRTPERHIRRWDRQAPTYDARMDLVERRWFAGSRAWVGSRAHGATLEVAIGTGANLPHYPDDLALTGVDSSPAMLEVARRRAESTGRTLTLHEADATVLPFPPGSFDTVVLTFSLCCIPDERAALTEALRVLRPGGSLLLADHVRATSWPLRALQHSVELVSVPLQGEHYTRRPVVTLGGLGAVVVETERLTHGAIEHVHARGPA